MESEAAPAVGAIRGGLPGAGTFPRPEWKAWEKGDVPQALGPAKVKVPDVLTRAVPTV